MRPEISAIQERLDVCSPSRRYLTKREVAALALSQGGLCACGCGGKLEPGNFICEHTIPLAIGENSKPDALWLIACARKKTKSDVANIAKCRRLRGDSGRRKPGARVAKIASRGFDRRFKKKMDGTTERRDDDSPR